MSNHASPARKSGGSGGSKATPTREPYIEATLFKSPHVATSSAAAASSSRVHVPTQSHEQINLADDDVDMVADKVFVAAMAAPLAAAGSNHSSAACLPPTSPHRGVSRAPSEHKSAINPESRATSIASLGVMPSTSNASAAAAAKVLTPAQLRKQELEDAALARKIAAEFGIVANEEVDEDEEDDIPAPGIRGAKQRRKKDEEEYREISEAEEEEYDEDEERAKKSRRNGGGKRRKQDQKPTSAQKKKSTAASRKSQLELLSSPATKIEAPLQSHAPTRKVQEDDDDDDVRMEDHSVAGASSSVAAAASASNTSPKRAAPKSPGSSAAVASSSHSHESIVAPLAAAFSPPTSSSLSLLTSPSVKDERAERLAQLQRTLVDAIEKQKRDAATAKKNEPLQPRTVSLRERISYYHLNERPCQSTPGRKSCAGKPNCMHGIICRPKKGIWATIPAPIKSLGIDPASRKRSGTISHAGLKNLGATCYMNTLFQCLFMNAHFRNAIYKFRSAEFRQQLTGVTPDLIKTPSLLAVGDEEAQRQEVADREQEGRDQDRILCELQNLFARLEFGHASYEDPTSIVKSLGLKRGDQQDINEFNNLFLEVLERRLKVTGDVSIATLIDDEFKGTLIHTIRCSRCKTRRDNASPFYDLTLQIAKLKSVKECLIKHMQKEELTGSNRYKCSQCHSLQDAERFTVIESLPPVLNLQLIRFGYDQFSDQKKKLQDNINIPATLDLTPFLDEKSIDQLAQELAIQQSTSNGATSSAGDSAAATADTMDVDAPILPLACSSPSRGPRSPARHTASPSSAVAAAASSSSSSSSVPNPYLYELTAVLRHKGASAHHGHYIADIRDPNDPARWWRFDDDSCKPLTQFDDGAGTAPTTDEKGKKGAAAKKKAKSGKKRKIGDVDSGDEDSVIVEEMKEPPKKKKADDDEEEEDEEEEEDTDSVQVIDSLPPAAKLNLDHISSRNAYMLVYTRVGRPRAVSVPRTDLTPEMEAQIQESDAKLKEQIEVYKQRKEEMIRLVDGRKQKAEQFLEMMQELEPIPGNEPKLLDSNYFVSGTWLREWYTGAPPEPKKDGVKVTKEGAIDCTTEEEVGPDGKISAALQREIEEKMAEHHAAEVFEMEEQKSNAMIDITDSSSSVAAAASSSSSTSTNVGPPPPRLMHPLWPGDLISSLRTFLCEHGKPAPAHPDMKRVSAEQWHLLYDDNTKQRAHLMKSPHSSSPSPSPPGEALSAGIRTSELCATCCGLLRASEDELAQQCDLRDRICDELVNFKHEFGPDGAFDDPTTMYLSKAYLKRWIAQAQKERPIEKFTQHSDEIDLNKSLKCEHQLLAPDEKDRFCVSQKIWDYLVVHYPSSTPFPNFANPCPECQRHAVTQTQKDDAWAERMEADKKAIKGKPIVKWPSLDRPPIHTPGTSHYILLPHEWANDYLQHIMGKRKVIPSQLNTRRLLCEPHGRLLYNPIPAAYRPDDVKSPYNAPGTNMDELAICDGQFWESLKKNGKYFANVDTDAVLIKFQAKVKGGEEAFHDGWSKYRITTDPPPCPECIAARIAASERVAAEWSQTSLLVTVLHPGAPLPSAVSGPPSGAVSRARRAVTRKAKVNASDVANTFWTPELNSSDTLTRLRLDIYQYTEANVPPGQQDIFCGGRKLEGDDRTLLQLGVPHNAELWVQRNLDGESDPSPWLGEDVMPVTRPAARPEAGFAGTALGGGNRRRAPPAAAASSSSSTAAASSPSPDAPRSSGGWICNVCTFANERAHLQCSMCQTSRA